MIVPMRSDRKLHYYHNILRQCVVILIYIYVYNAIVKAGIAAGMGTKGLGDGREWGLNVLGRLGMGKIFIQLVGTGWGWGS